MCGFAGVIAWDEKYRVSRDTLARMSAAVAHRGPDGEGTYFSPDAEITPDRPQVALAHRRLAIIDPDPRGNQPFTDNEGRWLVYNGEIYNYRELREELKRLKPDHAWRTDCDTEVLLVAYDVWGEKCVEHFNGMFAFAIWDGVKRELFLARDRMGQKPLYVTFLDKEGKGRDPHLSWGEKPPQPAAIVFASELSAVVANGSVPQEFSLCALTEYLQFGYLPRGATIYEGISQLQPASRARATASTCDESVFWPRDDDWPDQHRTRPASDEVAVHHTRELTRQAVRRQLVADVPLGCFLSGGVDSSVIAAAMKGSVDSGQEVLTFSIGFDDARYDESHHATAVAAHLGTRHQTFLVRPDAARDLPALAAVFAEPFGDSSALPTHYLARETRSHVKVALSGDGGDELFGGYDRYRAMATAQHLRRLTTRVPWMMLAPLARRLPGTHPKGRALRARRFLTSVGMSPEDRYSSYVRLFDGNTIVAMLGHHARTAKAFGPTHNDLTHWYWGCPPANYSGHPRDRIQDDVRAALALDRRLYLPGDLLTKVDRASMLHALEVRSPFMDHELVQFAAGLTTDQLLKGGPKRMLREAFADDLPAWVFKRKKMGFAVPIGAWVRGDLRPMLSPPTRSRRTST